MTEKQVVDHLNGENCIYRGNLPDVSAMSKAEIDAIFVSPPCNVSNLIKKVQP